MSFQLFDTKTGALQPFVPVRPGKVSMYVCGPTVQSAAHIGHVRSAIVYDVLRRWLRYRGFDVTLIRNVTDIDDKTLQASELSREQWWVLAYRVEREFNRVYDALGVEPPTYEPRATAHIGQMINMIRLLIQRGHAYVAEDGSGDVYFDVSTWADYGELTHQLTEKMESGEQNLPAKRNAHDFALWKGKKPSEPDSASFETPWGRGRPGWHIECSAMSKHYLGDHFDIHGGGQDLRFPHHENELAQSRAAGDEYATYWMHNGLVQVNGQKMSKSLGNSVYAADLLQRFDAQCLRYYFVSAHYRSLLDYQDSALEEASLAFKRLKGFLERAQKQDPACFATQSLQNVYVEDEFIRAMDNDLATPQAFSIIHETVRQGNIAFDCVDLVTAFDRARSTYVMMDVLGLNPFDSFRAGSTSTTAQKQALEILIESQLEQRNVARRQKDYARSDQIRDDLNRAGVVIEDTPEGAHWRIEA